MQSNSMKTPSSAIAAGSGAGSTYGLKMCAHCSGYSISCASNALPNRSSQYVFRQVPNCSLLAWKI